MAHEGGAGKRLVAYVVPRQGKACPDPAELQLSLADRLPEHMVPAVYVRARARSRSPPRQGGPAGPPRSGGGHGRRGRPTWRRERWRRTCWRRSGPAPSASTAWASTTPSSAWAATRSARSRCSPWPRSGGSPCRSRSSSSTRRSGARRAGPARARGRAGVRARLPAVRSPLRRRTGSGSPPGSTTPTPSASSRPACSSTARSTARERSTTTHSYRISGRFDAELCRRAVERLVSRHPALRTAFDLASLWRAAAARSIHRRGPGAGGRPASAAGAGAARGRAGLAGREPPPSVRLEPPAARPLPRPPARRRELPVHLQPPPRGARRLERGGDAARSSSASIWRSAMAPRRCRSRRSPPRSTISSASSGASSASPEAAAFWDRALAGVEPTPVPRRGGGRTGRRGRGDAPRACFPPASPTACAAWRGRRPCRSRASSSPPTCGCSP